MTTTMTHVMTDTVHADFGMPVAGRSRCSWQRGPVSLAVIVVPAAENSALIGSGTTVTDADYRSVVTGAARTDVAFEGAFPGAPAWSPPN